MKAILVTRPGAAGDPVVEALRNRGYRVHAIPTVATEKALFSEVDLTTYDWIVVTSATGVNAMADLPAGPRWAAIGQATAAALRARGVEPSLVPVEANGAALGDALPDVEGASVMLVRASGAAADLPTRLRERGAIVEEVTAYRTIEGPPASAAPLQSALMDVDLAAVVFASGSAVRGFVALGGSTDWPAITIGPRTTISAFECGFHVIAEAESQSAEALVAAVVRAIPLREKNRA